jgi:hypothetical protein
MCCSLLRIAASAECEELPAQGGGGLFKSGSEIPVHGGNAAVAESVAWCNDLGDRCQKGELR